MHRPEWEDGGGSLDLVRRPDKGLVKELCLNGGGVKYHTGVLRGEGDKGKWRRWQKGKIRGIQNRKCWKDWKSECQIKR